VYSIIYSHPLPIPSSMIEVVLPWRHPTKIRTPIIAGVAINVVDLNVARIIYPFVLQPLPQGLLRLWMKDFSNQSMHKIVPWAQLDNPVSVRTMATQSFPPAFESQWVLAECTYLSVGFLPR